MPNSYNGFPVITEQKLLKTLPGITGKVLDGPVWEIFGWLVEQYSTRVEAINPKDSWGYSYRKVRGGNSWSNHASGTAVDFNADRHPFKRGGTMTARQVAACHAIMNESNGILKWLEGFDEMHWEIHKGTSEAQLRQFARKIREGIALPPGPTGTLWKGNKKVGPSVGTRVREVQIRLNGMGWKLTEDGVYGDMTADAVAQFQALRGFPPKEIDGQFGVKTSAELQKARVEKWRKDQDPTNGALQ